MFRIIFILILSIFTGSCTEPDKNSAQMPNIILVITDDQGYGDLSCHGNPWLKTPNLDRLYEQSIRLTDFHVSPTCAPTRAALLTGHYTNRTGVWHTIAGRSLLRESELTMADVLSNNGYKTGIFGKWHLGDSYPFRPQDRGFQEVLVHKGGGVGQAPDYMDNNYFDDTYFTNGANKKYKGYCTDIWFEEAINFIDKNKDNPFFCYLTTNAPHGPYFVPDQYREPYKNNPEIPNPEFFGMIANFDENLGKLTHNLQKIGIEDNTILIFMTDNGSSSGAYMGVDGFVEKGFNAGMRGKKGSMYEGGHRVPCFIKWPNSPVYHGTDVDELTSHIDLLPTLIDILNLDVDPDYKFDGTSIKELITGGSSPLNRTIITDSQRIQYPEKWRRSSTMNGKWRLVNGQELYNISSDPEQRTDLAEKNPEKVAELQGDYESWWEEISPVFDEYPAITIGSELEKTTTLSSHDIHSEEQVAWNHHQVRSGLACNGWWALKVAREGFYKISLRRWPAEVNAPINSGLAAEPAIEGTSVTKSAEGKALPITSARLKVGNFDQIKSVTKSDKEVIFTVELPKGETRMQTWFTGENDLSLCSYYVYIEKI
jgi:arylsulfatase A-like enzyme